MKQDVRLYIDDKLVEFTNPYQIFFNYKTTELNKPTVIKNSYTRDITIEDTQRNNEIFNNIWNVEKINDNTFNANKKVDFVLYLNNEIYEKGYVKLNNVKRVKNRYEYSITLYGGLGELFYELSNTKKTLADLEYLTKNGSKMDLSFKINKETIFDAWNTINGKENGYYDEENVDRPSSYLFNEKWNTINFMTAYEGIPSNNFSPDKVLINAKDFNIKKTKDEYNLVNGYALGTANEDMTMNMTNDMRSYMLRPVISMKSIINACQNANNNGGWELKLDDYFFNDKNPYYTKSFITLNRLMEDKEEDVITEELNNVTIEKVGNDYIFNLGENNLENYENAEIDLQYIFNLDNTDAVNATRNKLYTSFDYTFNKTKNNKHNDYYKYTYDGAFLVQVVAYDEYGNVVTASDTHIYGTKGSSSLSTLFEKYKEKWEEDGVNTYDLIEHNGYFDYIENRKYLWNDDNGDNAFKFTFNNGVNFKTIKVKTMWITKIYYMLRLPSMKIWNPITNFFSNENIWVWANKTVTTEENFDNEWNVIYRLGGRHIGNVGVDLLNFYSLKTYYQNFFSNRLIKPKDYLTTEKTPSDYLISYCKMFGLYFWRDAKEVPSNPTKYPKGVIHILTRDKFYKLNNVVDLTEKLDRGRNFEITPYIFDKKYIDFEITNIESEVANEYKNKYGEEYGLKRIETEFDFNDETENLLKDNVFKSGIDVLEIDKYFNQRDENDLPSYFYNGFSYELFKNGDDGYDTTEINVDVIKKDWENINEKGIKNGDSFPKLQLHAKDNDAVDDGANILVFYNGSSLIDENNHYYYITDDVNEMYTLNEETPCYILTNSELDANENRIAYKVNEIPKFGRSKVEENGNIKYSWDMGNPKMNFAKGQFITQNMNITSNVWDKYISDLKDKNNKKLKCYINFMKYPDAHILRDLYWYENCYWQINEVKNWNIVENQPVECEMVKILDKENYKTNKIEFVPPFILKIEGMLPVKIVKNDDVQMTTYTYNISKDKLSFNIIVYNEDNLIEWEFGDYFYIRDFETGQTREEPFSWYTDAPQYNFGSKSVKIRLPRSEYKQIFDFYIINSETGWRYRIEIETDGII